MNVFESWKTWILITGFLSFFLVLTIVGFSEEILVLKIIGVAVLFVVLLIISYYFIITGKPINSKEENK